MQCRKDHNTTTLPTSSVPLHKEPLHKQKLLHKHQHTSECLAALSTADIPNDNHIWQVSSFFSFVQDFRLDIKIWEQCPFPGGLHPSLSCTSTLNHPNSYHSFTIRAPRPLVTRIVHILSEATLQEDLLELQQSACNTLSHANPFHWLDYNSKYIW